MINKIILICIFKLLSKGHLQVETCLHFADIVLLWRHNGRDSVLNHQPRDCLLNRLFRRRSKKTSKLRVTGLCAGNSPGTGEFPAQMASNAENVPIWWRHHGTRPCLNIVSNKLWFWVDWTHGLSLYQLFSQPLWLNVLVDVFLV